MMNEPMQPMRVAYLINQYPAVSHSFIRREILELERSGVDVVRIALRGWKDVVDDAEHRREREKTRYIQRLGVFRLLMHFARTSITSPMRTISMLALALRMARQDPSRSFVHLFYLVEACAVAAILAREDVRHLHAHFGTNSTEIAMLACGLTGGTYSFTVHGPEEFDKAKSIGLATKVARSAFAVAISSFGRGQLYRWIDRGNWNKVKVVHCGLEPGFHTDVTVAAPVQKRLVCVGRLCEQKGQLLLLQAAELLVRRGRDFQLVLAGDGELRRQIEDDIASRGLGRHVSITGWLSNTQVREQLLHATALVLPSLAEGLPVAIMEAMALRRPVLSTYIAGIPELVRPGINGWLFPSGSPEDLAAAMEHCLLASASELDAMGVAARAAVLERHDIRSEALKLKEHFVAVLNDGARPIRG